MNRLLDILSKISDAGKDGLEVAYPDFKCLTENEWAESVPPKIETQHGSSRTCFTIKATQLRPDIIHLTAKGNHKLEQLRDITS